MRIHTVNIISIFSVSVLASCGGGGGGGGSSSSASSTAASPVVSTPAVESTRELTTSQTFLLQSNTTLSLQVNVADLASERAYMNLCHGNDSGINYNNCVLNTPIQAGTFTAEIEIGNDIDNLHLEIWKYDISSEPYLYHWNRDAGLEWEVN